MHAAFRGKWQSGRLHAKESGGGPRGIESVRRGRDLPNRVGELNGADSGTGSERGLHASQSDGQREFEVTASRNLEPLWKSIDFDETVFPPTMPTGQTWESIFADCGPAAQGDPSIEPLPERSETPDQHWLVQAVWATAGSHPSTPRGRDRSCPARYSSMQPADWPRFQDLLRPPKRGPLANVPPTLGRLAWLPVSSSRAIGRWCRLGRPSTPDATTPRDLGDPVHPGWWPSPRGRGTSGGRHPTPARWFREAKGFNNGVFHLQRAGLGHRQQEQSGQPNFVVRGRGPDPGGLEFAFPSCFAHRDDRGQSVGPGDAINQDGGWRGGWVIGLDRQSGRRAPRTTTGFASSTVQAESSIPANVRGTGPAAGDRVVLGPPQHAPRRDLVHARGQGSIPLRPPWTRH